MGGTVESPTEETETHVEKVQKIVNGEVGGGATFVDGCCAIGIMIPIVIIVVIIPLALLFIAGAGSEPLPPSSLETNEDVQPEENSSETHTEWVTESPRI